MDVFCDYANFYDALYEDKDYQKECEFLKSVFDTFNTKKTSSILDLGCGTGSHSIILAEMGFSVTGIDQSEYMLKTAKRKATEKNVDIEFKKQDIRNLNLPQKSDAAVAMFAVMGYQVSNLDFESTLISVCSNLQQGGIFVFDVWFGPAVIKEDPQDRLKEVISGNKRIIRYAHPILDELNQTVEVNYTVLEIAGNKVMAEIKEHHLMRYFFYQELLYFLGKTGFETILICPFLELHKHLNRECWNITIICKKN